MTTTRKITISGNWRKNDPTNEWAGSGTVNQLGAIECAAALGEDTYDAIESQIANGDTKGRVTVHSDEQDRDVTYSWSIE